MSFLPRLVCRLFLPITLAAAPLRAQNPSAEGALVEVAFSQLSDRGVSALGRAALEIEPTGWKHAESKNFVYHYFQSFVATPVSVEAEFFYGIVAKELERDTTAWERKAHIFIFEKPDAWAQFQKRGALDPWTGGIHAGGELFLLRNPELKWKGNTLGHEVVHLVIHRFFGPGVPLWLNEGYAEYASSRGYAAFHRARGYIDRPKVQAVNPALFIPLEKLVNAVSYPAAEQEVEIFYAQSERLVRFLCALNKPGFVAFLDSLAKGDRFDSALSKGFPGRFSGLDALESGFKPYATKEHGTSLQD